MNETVSLMSKQLLNHTTLKFALLLLKKHFNSCQVNILVSNINIPAQKNHETCNTIKFIMCTSPGSQSGQNSSHCPNHSEPSFCCSGTYFVFRVSSIFSRYQFGVTEQGFKSRQIKNIYHCFTVDPLWYQSLTLGRTY